MLKIRSMRTTPSSEFIRLWKIALPEADGMRIQRHPGMP